MKKGDLLFEIDSRPFRAEIRRLQAQLEQAQAKQGRARSEADRGERLHASNAISTEAANARAAMAQEARAEVAAIQAQLDTARLNLEFTRITAPIAGRIGRAEAKAGNLVNAGETLLASLISTEQIHAWFDIDESAFLTFNQSDLGTLGADRPVRVVHLGLSSEDGTPHLGLLDFIDNQVNPRTGTMRARAVFDNSSGRFTPGLYARLRVSSGEASSTILIRDEAIGTDLGKRYVLVLNDDNQASYRAVELGPRVAGLRVIRQGLRDGERIIVNGLQRARPGAYVQPSEVEMADDVVTRRLAKLHREPTQVIPITVKANPPSALPRG